MPKSALVSSLNSGMPGAHGGWGGEPTLADYASYFTMFTRVCRGSLAKTPEAILEGMRTQPWEAG